MKLDRCAVVAKRARRARGRRLNQRIQTGEPLRTDPGGRASPPTAPKPRISAEVSWTRLPDDYWEDPRFHDWTGDQKWAFSSSSATAPAITPAAPSLLAGKLSR